MDKEKRERLQSLRVIISETIMVVTVAITVLILAFVVSGYWLSPDFKVERQGMLQISSLPTGADVDVDGESSWMQRTNTSKILSSGEHTVVLTKEGYDSWTKKVEIKEGLLYRLHYPRLFLTERTKEELYDVTSTKYATVSPNHNYLLLINDTTKWSLINLDSNEIKPQTLDISGLFIDSADPSATPVVEILSTNWDFANEHVLIKTSLGGVTEWALLNTRNVTESINLNRELATTFDDVRIFDNSSSTLLALRNGELYRIDVPGRQISTMIAKNVMGFDFANQEIVFVAKKDLAKKENVDEAVEAEPAKEFFIASTKNTDSAFEEIMSLDASATPAIIRFYDEEYLAILSGNEINLYNKQSNEKVFSKTLDFTPDSMKVGFGGDFVVMTSGENIATLDMEAMQIVSWSTETPRYGWLDSSMIYAVKDGELIVYDYDGLNRRPLSHNVSSHFPVTITANKWLYYFSDNQLMRERIVK